MPDRTLKKILLGVSFLILPLIGCADTGSNVILLGDSADIPFDGIKSAEIASAVDTLLASCTVATLVKTVPAVTYKGVRITRPDGKIIEAHIFPNSMDSYRVELYTRENGVTTLHGKYRYHAYPLISMLEVKKNPPRT